jgi:hypothetical protein
VPGVRRAADTALPPPLPRAVLPIPRRLRVLAWQLRFVVAAGCLAIAVSATVGALRPAPPAGADVLVAAHDLPAGHTLTTADLAVVTVPERLAVAGAAASDEVRATLIGATTAVAVPAGLPLVPQVLAAGSLTGPPGTVVAAVRLADETLAALLSAGDRVDLLAAPPDGGDGVVLAHRALVLPAAPRSTGSGLLGGGGDETAPLLVAVLPDEAAALAGSAASNVLFAVVVP